MGEDRVLDLIREAYTAGRLAAYFDQDEADRPRLRPAGQAAAGPKGDEWHH